MYCSFVDGLETLFSMRPLLEQHQYQIRVMCQWMLHVLVGGVGFFGYIHVLKTCSIGFFILFTYIAKMLMLNSIS